MIMRFGINIVLHNFVKSKNNPTFRLQAKQVISWNSLFPKNRFDYNQTDVIKRIFISLILTAMVAASAQAQHMRMPSHEAADRYAAMEKSTSHDIFPISTPASSKLLQATKPWLRQTTCCRSPVPLSGSATATAEERQKDLTAPDLHHTSFLNSAMS